MYAEYTGLCTQQESTDSKGDAVRKNKQAMNGSATYKVEVHKYSTL